MWRVRLSGGLAPGLGMMLKFFSDNLAHDLRRERLLGHTEMGA